MHDVLLVDRQPIFLQGLETVLQIGDRFAVRSVQSVEAALMMLREFRPDIALVDHAIDGHGGLQILHQLRDLGGIPALFLATEINPESTIIAIRLGIRGIILKDSSAPTVLQAISSVLNGGTFFDARVTEAALRFSVENPRSMRLNENDLTERERAIVDYVCQGMRNREIADCCQLAEGTIKAHLHNIFSKLGVSSRAQLIASMHTVDAVQG